MSYQRFHIPLVDPLYHVDYTNEQQKALTRLFTTAVDVFTKTSVPMNRLIFEFKGTG